MRTIRKVEYTPVFVETMPDNYERGKVYISETYKVANHICLCGCDNMTVMPFGDPKYWQLVKESNGTVSFIGSVGNYSFPCKSHYIMTKNNANFV